jgi:cytochrome b6
MTQPQRKALRLALILSGAVLLVVAGFGVHGATASASTLEAAMSGVESEAVSFSPPPPNQDTCLSCHINGETTNLWTPLARWSVFGVFGMVFAFGVYRSASVWTGRKAWKPLWTRTVEWVDERYELSPVLSKLAAKPVPRFAMKWWYCLGGITAFLFVVQGITGIMLAFYYKPSAAEAYNSILFIENEVRFGAATRMIHHWAANGMIVMCIAHMLRVFIMGAYKKPRELNWVSGVLLLFLTLLFGFTGYLLPWDQRAYWATTVGTDIGGALPAIGDLILVFLRVGWDVSDATLGRFYGMHIIVTPLLTVGFMLAHFMMIRKLGVQRPL